LKWIGLSLDEQRFILLRELSVKEARAHCGGFSVADHEPTAANNERRKDSEVIDETPRRDQSHHAHGGPR
jgi:hypothetical protein